MERKPISGIYFAYVVLPEIIFKSALVKLLHKYNINYNSHRVEHLAERLDYKLKVPSLVADPGFQIHISCDWALIASI